jgi:hypothetical protein
LFGASYGKDEGPGKDAFTNLLCTEGADFLEAKVEALIDSNLFGSYDFSKFDASDPDSFLQRFKVEEAIEKIKTVAPVLFRILYQLSVHNEERPLHNSTDGY